MLSRRRFFGIVSTAVVATALSTHIPLEWVPQPIRYQGALGYLLRAYAEHTKGLKFSEFPQWAYVGNDLWDAFATEIQASQRFTRASDEAAGWRSLMFKGVSLLRHSPGWYVRFGVIVTS
jgi:hypothetical protein